jgi:hypothetical protein
MTRIIRVCASSVALAIIAQVSLVYGQSGGSSWKRSAEAPATPQRVFHSPYVINLPSAATYQKGFFQFEISHRFIPPISDGIESFYGFDGPANIRLALGYAATDRLTFTLGRSNQYDNYDLLVKYGGLKWKLGSIPTEWALLAGAAWNTEYPGRDAGHNLNFQYFGQIIFNVLATKRLALGVVPSYLYNAVPESDEAEHAVTVGLYGQVYLSTLLSVIAEWNITEAGYYYKHDAAALGIELETGGHFFKIVVTNSTSLNLSQYLIGTNDEFKPDNWRIGFLITRLLHF